MGGETFVLNGGVLPLWQIRLRWEGECEDVLSEMYGCQLAPHVEDLKHKQTEKEKFVLSNMECATRCACS